MIKSIGFTAGWDFSGKEKGRTGNAATTRTRNEIRWKSVEGKKTTTWRCVFIAFLCRKKMPCDDPRPLPASASSRAGSLSGRCRRTVDGHWNEATSRGVRNGNILEGGQLALEKKNDWKKPVRQPGRGSVNLEEKKRDKSVSESPGEIFAPKTLAGIEEEASSEGERQKIFWNTASSHPKNSFESDKKTKGKTKRHRPEPSVRQSKRRLRCAEKGNPGKIRFKKQKPG